MRRIKLRIPTKNLDTDNTATKATVKWVSFSDQNGSDPKDLGTGDSYEIQAADADRYIGIKITPTTTTGDPAVATELLLKDLSTDAGGGSDDDEIPEGPVVDENVHVVIHEKDSNTNLLKNSGTTLKTNTTYQVLLWSDKNGNGTYDAGENVTDQYDYRWKFVGAAFPWVATVSRALVCPSTTNANKLSSTYHSPRGVVFSAHFA